MFVSVAEVKDYLKLRASDTSEDPVIVDLIWTAMMEMEQAHGRVLRLGTYTEKYNGTGEDQLFLKAYPVHSVTSVKVDGNTLASTNYEVDGERGILYGPWTEGIQNVEVTYKAGYEYRNNPTPDPTVPVLPDDLRIECLERVAFLYQNRGGRR